MTLGAFHSNYSYMLAHDKSMCMQSPVAAIILAVFEKFELTKLIQTLDPTVLNVLYVIIIHELIKPLCVSVYGMMGREATRFVQHLADQLRQIIYSMLNVITK